MNTTATRTTVEQVARRSRISTMLVAALAALALTIVAALTVAVFSGDGATLAPVELSRFHQGADAIAGNLNGGGPQAPDAPGPSVAKLSSGEPSFQIPDQGAYTEWRIQEGRSGGAR